jgi:hypothetical protein
MKKLRLEIDQLDVQSFQVGEAAVAGGGTVKGFAITRLATCPASCGYTACSDPSCLPQTCYCN